MSHLPSHRRRARRRYLKTLRERLGFSQAAVATKSGVAQNTISKLETNENSNPVLATVRRLAKVFKVDPSDLRFGPPPKRRSRRKARLLVS